MARLPKLKHCPFCRENDAFVERADFSSAYVFCNRCSARGPTACQESDNEEIPGERSARRMWNMRARRAKPQETANASAC